MDWGSYAEFTQVTNMATIENIKNVEEVITAQFDQFGSLRINRKKFANRECKIVIYPLDTGKKCLMCYKPIKPSEEYCIDCAMEA